MHARDLQRALAALGLYSGALDGDIGPNTGAAIDALLVRHGIHSADWPAGRRRVAAEQIVMRDAGIDTGAIDGLTGPQTRAATEAWAHLPQHGRLPDWRDAEMVERAGDERLPAAVKNVWPRQAEVSRFFGEPGKNQRPLRLPFAMRLAWDTNTVIQQFAIHEKAHDSAARVFERILDAYGPKAIQDLGLNLFGGCLNNRAMRGGTALSMHAWGIAIDFDPERNQLRWDRTRARLARPEYGTFWRLWEEEGWLSLGRARDFDWMHVQAARL